MEKIKKYVVIAVWGQSNAVGFDEGDVNEFDTPLYDGDRILQVSAVSGEIIPLTYCAENLQDMNTVIPEGFEGKPQRGTKGIHLPLANILCKVLPDNVGVILVPYGYGGKDISFFIEPEIVKGFTKNIKRALDMNPENKFSGIVWCQGENDSDTMDGKTYGEKFAYLRKLVDEELEEYHDRFVTKVDKSWYFYEFPVYFRNQKFGREILEAIKKNVGEDHYIPLREDHPVNVTNYTSKNNAAHYAGDFFRTDVAPLVYACMNCSKAFELGIKGK